MIYLKKFETTSQYNAYTADTANFIKPNVSLITETNTVEYNPLVIPPTPPTPSHDYVEIGGIKWATMNIGAESVTDGGLYFSWGNVEGHAKDSGYDFSQATYDGTSGATLSGDITADSGYDMARENWGGDWRLPTMAETTALVNATTSAWTTDYQGTGVSGLVLTDKTDSSKVLFFPAVGNYYGAALYNEGSGGCYWSSSFGSATNAYRLNFNSSGVNPQYGSGYRCYGFSVRAVQ